MCSSSTPAAASASQSFQIASVHPPSSRQTAPTRTSDDGKPPAVPNDGTIHTNNTNASTAMSAAAAASYEEQPQPLLTFTAPLNDVPRGGHSGTYRQNNIPAASTSAAAGPQAHNPTPTTTILPPTKRPADGSSDALLDDLERWCHRQFGTAFASASATSASAAAGEGGGRKRRRTASTTTATTSDIGSGGAAGNVPLQMPQAQMPQAQMPQAQMAQHAPQQVPQPQPQPAQGLPSAHSLTTSPSSLTTRKTLANRPTSTSFTDLLQLLDAHELKEAIATGSVFDDDLAAQQSALPGLAPYAADVWGDLSGMGLGLGGWTGGSGSSSSLLAYDDLLAGIGLGASAEGGPGEQRPHNQQVKMPSSIAGSGHGSVHGSSSSSSSSGRSSRNDPTASTQRRQPPSCAYEMMTSDVALPAETREELRVAYPHPPSLRPAHPGQQPQQQPQQQQQQQPQPRPYQQAPPGMMPAASVDEVTPRSSNVHTSSCTNSAYPAQYSNAPQDYHHQPLCLPPPQFQAPAASQYRFLESLEFSTQSERLLREWDRSMGLKACHSKTMLRTSKSRKKLLDKVGNVGRLMASAALVGVGSYPPAYPTHTSTSAMGYATASAYAAEQKKMEEGDGTVMGNGNRSTSHESFQDQIEKNSQTATMA